MSHSVRNHLRVDVEAYDAAIRRWIPGYEKMLRVAARAVAASEPTVVVDLGCGTGALSAAILEQVPGARVEMLDIDPEMLARARSRVAAFGSRARPTLRSFAEELPRCGAVCASLALHHISDFDEKVELFARIHEALETNGVFVNADCCMPVDADARRPLFEHWARHQVGEGIPEERAWEHFEEWAAEDTYFPVEAELDALVTVGFQAERVWNDGPIGVIVATKSGTPGIP